MVDKLNRVLAKRALNAEMDHHLDGEAAEGRPNSRNGYGQKTLLTDSGKRKRGPTAACRFGAFGSRVGVRHRRWWTPGLAWWGRLHGLEFGPAGMER